jgi:hypothetical protein
MNKSAFQNERPKIHRETNQVTFLGKVIALIIPKDVSNFTSKELSDNNQYKGSNKQK